MKSAHVIFILSRIDCFVIFNPIEAFQYLKSHTLDMYSFNFFRVFDGEIKRKFSDCAFKQEENKKANFQQSLTQKVEDNVIIRNEKTKGIFLIKKPFVFRLKKRRSQLCGQKCY